MNDKNDQGLLSEGVPATERQSDALGSADGMPAVTEPLSTIDALESLLDRSSDSQLAATQPPSESTPACDVDDDEISEYMASLMERYGIRKEPERRADPAVTAPAPSSTPSQAAVEPSAAAEGPQSRPESADGEVPRREPSRPPETATDIASLRYLANASARSAVNAHLVIQIVAAAYTKLTLAIVATFSSALCAFSAQSVASPIYAMAVASGAAGVFWVAQYWRLTGELRTLLARSSSREAAAANSSA